YVCTHNRTWLGRVFPFLEASLDILKEKHVPGSVLVYVLLLKLNLLHMAWYYKTCAQDFCSWLWRLVRGSRSAPWPQAPASTRKSPSRLVTPTRSRYSQSGTAYLRVVPSKSRISATVTPGPPPASRSWMRRRMSASTLTCR